RKLHVQFGIIPLGSGNGLAFTASIPKSVTKALEVIFKGEAKTTDAFMINKSFACMLCGIGFDAQVAHDFANDPNRGLGTYIKKTIANFFTAKAYPFVLHMQEREIVTEALFISVANSNQFGNNFTIAPKAVLNDGLLDIVVMTKQNKFSVLLQAIKQVGGYNEVQEVKWIDESAGVLYFQTDHLAIINKELAPMHIDGDPVASERKINIELIKDCFKLISP
ncbi:MAG TPA: diacylglycerol kinase family protein, partial [Flavisolibacter sp.]|nr:diacylglycerol kinase family protein [Flavisolibacter sp.]